MEGHTPRSRSQGQKYWYPWKGLVTGNTHVKYESPTTYHSKVKAKVKVFLTDGQTDRRTDGQTGFNVPALLRKRGTIINVGKKSIFLVEFMAYTICSVLYFI